MPRSNGDCQPMSRLTSPWGNRRWGLQSTSGTSELRIDSAYHFGKRKRKGSLHHGRIVHESADRI